jgi:hypothetical protein
LREWPAHVWRMELTRTWKETHKCIRKPFLEAEKMMVMTYPTFNNFMQENRSLAMALKKPNF